MKFCPKCRKRKRHSRWCPYCRSCKIKYNKEYRKIRRKQIAKSNKKYNLAHPERQSVRNHYRLIFKDNHPRCWQYAGMPFFKDWNPYKGGSFASAEKWIIENLGSRPKGCQLHIINHEKGFVPGNLEWTYPRKQINQQMFKIIAQQKNYIKKLEFRLSSLGENLNGIK